MRAAALRGVKWEEGAIVRAALRSSAASDAQGKTSASGNPASPSPKIAKICNSVNRDFLIALPRRGESLHFQTAYLTGELTGDRRFGTLRVIPYRKG